MPDPLKKTKSSFPCQESKHDSAHVLVTIPSMSFRSPFCRTQLKVWCDLLQISVISSLVLEFRLLIWL